MKEEHGDVDRSLKAAADATECLLDEGVTKAMNAFNTKLVKPKPEPKSEPKKVSPKQSDSKSDTKSNKENTSTQPGSNTEMENKNVN